MTIDRRAVEHVAALARLALTDQELDRFAQQLGQILAYCAKLNELEADNVEPTSSVIGMTNVVRDDIPRPSLSRDEVLAAAPAHDAGFFTVPPVIETEPHR